MSDKVIVTIDREFGSGGHEVAKRLADRLGVPFYAARNPIAVSGIITGSPAEAAGFKGGDQLLSVFGKTISSTKALFDTLQENQTATAADFLIAQRLIR